MNSEVCEHSPSKFLRFTLVYIYTRSYSAVVHTKAAHLVAMLKQLIFALMACMLVATCLGASTHVSKSVPSKICSKSGGWNVFSIKNNNFNPPSSSPMARDLLIRQMKALAPQMVKDAAAAYNSSPAKNATLFTTFGTEGSWVLDGCMKVRTLFFPVSRRPRCFHN